MMTLMISMAPWLPYSVVLINITAEDGSLQTWQVELEAPVEIPCFLVPMSLSPADKLKVGPHKLISQKNQES